MKVNAWIQMGCERREVTFDVTEAEIERVGEKGLEMYIEEAVEDWWRCRYGCGVGLRVRDQRLELHGGR